VPKTSLEEGARQSDTEQFKIVANLLVKEAHQPKFQSTLLKPCLTAANEFVDMALALNNNDQKENQAVLRF